MWRSASGSSSLSSFGGTVGVGEGSTVDGRAVLPFGASSQSGQSGWSVGGGLLLTFFLVGGVGSVMRYQDFNNYSSVGRGGSLPPEPLTTLTLILNELS